MDFGLPKEIAYKIGKTSETRGAQPYERVPFQNRVNRWNRAVVPFEFRATVPPGGYQNGFAIMVKPEQYFEPATLKRRNDFPIDVQLGKNAFLYYDSRKRWNMFNPQKAGLEPLRHMRDGKAIDRRAGGTDEGDYLARVPGTTAPGEAGEQVVHGPPQGIRFFEYASELECFKAEVQLALLAWKTKGIEKVTEGGPPPHLIALADQLGLADWDRLRKLRVFDGKHACCPLCLGPIAASMLMSKVSQQQGREVVDLTITEANLFHLEDLRPGTFGHHSYGLGWGHHHCNATARDHGIEKTLDWMEEVLLRAGRLPPNAKATVSTT